MASSLGKVELEMVSVAADVKSDTSVMAHVILRQCVLDDTRPGKEKGITRYVLLCSNNTSYYYVQHSS